MHRASTSRLLAALGLVASLCFAARADIPPQPAPTAQTETDPQADAEHQEFLAEQKATLGPARIVLNDQASLNLPAGYAFIPPETARALMKKMGNSTDDKFLGLVFPGLHRDVWFAILEYDPSGYIKDDDAKSWDTDEMLRQMKENTEKDNAERRMMNQPELEVLGWVEKPHYEGATHRLVWSIGLRDKGTTDTAKNIVNYHSFLLGREGYIVLNLVTDQSAIEGEKPIANLLLSKTQFVPGKRYENFNASTDRVAEYGLAALVGGVVIKKLGLLGLIAAFAAKFIKAIGIAVAGGAAAVTRLFRRKKPAGAGDMRAQMMQPEAKPPVHTPVDPPTS